ncbi:hypothetical protein B9Z55_027191 [Caenorhabditis nigoni]|uniref:Nematode cuticle collagen N-terminal domain-containing protein n=1 Tax=Caenorhabditis nigoni TaxID=1611254 RepID=A0A2G5SH61_9PELO|nr:hypothetical protein B9Z55_027191 [Caenorhabditis nigoni]
MIIMGIILIVASLYDWYEEQQADVENAGDLENEFPNDAKRSKQQEDPAISLEVRRKTAASPSRLLPRFLRPRNGPIVTSPHPFNILPRLYNPSPS